MTLARPAQLLRAGDRARDLGRPARRGRSGRAARPSGGARARRDDELPGRAGQGRRACSTSSSRSPAGTSTAMRRWSAATTLNAYLAAAIRTDHESTSFEEARGEAARRACRCWRARAASPRTSRRWRRCSSDLTWPSFAFCTDDRNPLEIAEEGHIDFAIRKAIRAGAPPLAAYRAASFGAARAFRPVRSRPDRRRPARRHRAARRSRELRGRPVICGGVPIDEQAFAGRSRTSRRSATARSGARRSRRRCSRCAAAGPAGPVIGARRELAADRAPDAGAAYRDGLRLPDPAQGVHKLAVLERHGVNGNVGRGFVKGFGALHGRARQQHRPRLPQHHRGRRRRRRHGAGGQPADRAAGRLPSRSPTARCGRSCRCRSPGLMSDRPFEEVESGAARAARARAARWAARWPSPSCSSPSCRCR